MERPERHIWESRFADRGKYQNWGKFEKFGLELGTLPIWNFQKMVWVELQSEFWRHRKVWNIIIAKFEFKNFHTMKDSYNTNHLKFSISVKCHFCENDRYNTNHPETIETRINAITQITQKFPLWHQCLQNYTGGGYNTRKVGTYNTRKFSIFFQNSAKGQLTT